MSARIIAGIAGAVLAGLVLGVMMQMMGAPGADRQQREVVERALALLDDASAAGAIADLSGSGDRGLALGDSCRRAE